MAKTAAGVRAAVASAAAHGRRVGVTAPRASAARATAARAGLLLLPPLLREGWGAGRASQSRGRATCSASLRRSPPRCDCGARCSEPRGERRTRPFGVRITSLREVSKPPLRDARCAVNGARTKRSVLSAQRSRRGPSREPSGAGNEVSVGAAQPSVRPTTASANTATPSARFTLTSLRMVGSVAAPADQSLAATARCRRFTGTARRWP